MNAGCAKKIKIKKKKDKLAYQIRMRCYVKLLERVMESYLPAMEPSTSSILLR